MTTHPRSVLSLHLVLSIFTLIIVGVCAGALADDQAPTRSQPAIRQAVIGGAGATVSSGVSDSVESGQEAKRTPQKLKARLSQQADAGKFSESLATAEEYLKLLESIPDVLPYQLVDAERHIESLSRIARLSEEDQKRYLEATQKGKTVRKYLWAGKFDKAEEQAEQAIAIARELLGGEFSAQFLYTLAAVQKARSNYTKADSLFRQAIAHARKQVGGQNPQVAAYLNDQANVLQEMGNTHEAEPLYREALSILHPLSDYEYDSNPAIRMGYFVSSNNLAVLFADRGDYIEAEPLYREALAFFFRVFGSEHKQTAGCLNNLAVVLRDKGDYTGAEAMFRESLTMQKEVFGETSPDVATGLYNLGVTLALKGDLAGAEVLHREALSVLRACFGDEHPQVKNAIAGLAGLLVETGQYELADSLSREALALEKKLGGDAHPDLGDMLESRAGLLWLMGDVDNAAQLYRESVSTLRECFGSNHPGVARCLRRLAALRIEREDYAMAESLLVEAAEVYDAARLRVGSGITRATFQMSPYPLLAAVRLRANRPVDAWPAVEKHHGRILSELLHNTRARRLAPLECAKQDSLESELSRLHQELEVHREMALSDTAEELQQKMDEGRNRVLAVEAEWSAFQLEIARRYPVSAGEAYPLDRVQAALGPHAAILGWLDARSDERSYGSWAYVIRETGPVTWARIEGKGSTDAEGIDTRRIHEALRTPERMAMVLQKNAQSLWAERIAPLHKALDSITDLIVIPSGAMLGVPVEVLVDDEGTTLDERFTISYVPSATIYAWLSEGRDHRTHMATRRALLVGDPPFKAAHADAMEEESASPSVVTEQSSSPVQIASGRGVLSGNRDAVASLPRLPGTRREVARIAPIAGVTTVLLGADATEQKLVALATSGLLKDYGVIHIATHAIVDDEQPERSALILSQVDLPDPIAAIAAGDRIFDGLLTAGDVAREWELKADLVTLSACQTGLGKVVGGEGFVGFAHSFLQAGARSLLVSLWKVDDRATSLLMQRFYENWTGAYDDVRDDRRGEAMPKANALREAKKYLRNYVDDRGTNPYEHPFFWSAFILIGDRS